MNASLRTIRAIGAEFASRLWLPAFVLACIISMLVIGLAVYLQISVSPWWVILSFISIILASAAIGFLLIVKQIIRTVSPVKTEQQRTATKQFVDKLQEVSDVLSTPKLVILFQVVRDIVAPRKDGYVATMIHNSTSLTSDLKQLSRLFK